jgi:uncharacterized protein (TIGR02594 family)
MSDVTRFIAAGILQRGSKNREAVTELQTALKGLGFPVEVDGFFGGETETAVTAFQKLRGLKADGEVGAQTAAALDGPAPAAPAAALPSALTESPTDRPLWLVAALGWVGTKEQPGSGDNPVILNWAKGVGGDIAKEYTHDAIPWCALFVNAVLQQVGLKGTGTLWALDFAQWGQKIAGPTVGAFAPMKRDGGGHITIVVGRDKNGNLMCCGGNQSDAVTVTAFDPDRVVSWRWPAGEAAPATVGFNALPLVRSNGRVSTNEQ